MTRNALKPTEFQESVIHKFVDSNARGGILGLGTGVGKTTVSVEILKRMGAERVLIMGPESTFDSWASTLLWQTGRKLRRAANNALTFSLTPDPTRRDEVVSVKLTAAMCKGNLQACLDGEPGFYFVTRELFTSKVWSKVPVTRGGEPVIDPKTKKPKMRNVRKDVWGAKKPFDVVVVDENQKFATKGNRGQKAFQHVQATFRMVSSADWFSTDLANMHRVACDVFGDEVVGMNYAEFEDEYLETAFDPFAYTKRKVVGEKIPGLFASSLPLYVTAPPSVTPPESVSRYVSLGREERALYDQLEQYNVARVGDEFLTTTIPLTLRIRLRELSLGTFKVIETGEVDEDGVPKQTIEFPENMRSVKLDEIKSIMAGHPGEHLIVSTHSAKWARRAAQMLGGEAWTGGASKQERADMKRRFLEGENKLLFVIPEAFGVGTDGFQAVCNRIVFASRSDQSLMHSQTVARIARTGQERQVEVIDLIARDTYDEGVIHRIDDKIARNNESKGWNE